jgi:ubiquinone/menaquinone biosynthesis C-methylase UbiE
MATLNRLPGGVGASVSAVTALLDGRPSTVLDAGCGFGDFARRLRRAHGGAVIAADVSPEVVSIARGRLAAVRGVEVLHADVRALPLDDGAVDVAHASLLLHHLDADDAVTAFTEMRRVARGGVVVNDLRRGPIAFAVTAATVLALSRSPMTHHDGVLSARRAWSLAEQDGLAARAGLRPVWRTPSAWPRVTTVYR